MTVAPTLLYDTVHFFGIAFWHIKMVYAKAFQVLSTFGGAPANLNFSTQFRRSPRKNWVLATICLEMERKEKLIQLRNNIIQLL